MFASIALLTEWNKIKISILSRKVYALTFFKNIVCTETIGDQVFDRNDVQIPCLLYTSDAADE